MTLDSRESLSAAPPDAAALERVSDSMLVGALWLVETFGARVFPVHPPLADSRCSCGTVCDRSGKHPAIVGWQDRATTDERAIRELWARHPGASVGLATGAASGIIAIDIDGDAGRSTLAALEAKHGPLPATVTVRTARGQHLYFSCSELPPIRNRAGERGAGIGKGIDVRGEAGFVVAPPSWHASGCPYEFEAQGAELAKPPAWLSAMLVEPARPTGREAQAAEPLPASGDRADRWARAALDRELGAVRSAPEGRRNGQLNTSAFSLGTLVGGGRLDAGLVRRALRDAAVEAGLSELEALRTITSGLNAGMVADVRNAPSRELPPSGSAQHTVTIRTSAAPDPRQRTVSVMTQEPSGPDQPTATPIEADEVQSQPPAAMRERRIELVGTEAIFAPLPPTQWAIEGLQLGPGRPMLIAGFGASAKTISMQSLALSLAAGKPVWGHFECSPLRVVHLDYEMSFAATAKRYQRLAAGHGVELAELGGRLRLNPKLPSVRLSDESAKQALIDLGDESDVILIDSFRAALVGVDENDSKVRNYVDLLMHASQETGCSYILIAHAGKPSREYSLDARTRARGSSAIFDGAGAVLNFDRKLPSNPVCVAVSMSKPSESATGEIERFELHLEDTPAAHSGDDTFGGVRVLWRSASDDSGAEAAGQATVKRGRNLAAVERDARTLARVLSRESGGFGERKLRALVSLSGESWGRDRLEAAKARLAQGVDGWKITNRGSASRPAFHVEHTGDGGDE